MSDFIVNVEPEHDVILGGDDMILGGDEDLVTVDPRNIDSFVKDHGDHPDKNNNQGTTSMHSDVMQVDEEGEGAGVETGLQGSVVKGKRSASPHPEGVERPTKQPKAQSNTASSTTTHDRLAANKTTPVLVEEEAEKQLKAQSNTGSSTTTHNRQATKKTTPVPVQEEQPKPQSNTGSKKTTPVLVEEGEKQLKAQSNTGSNTTTHNRQATKKATPVPVQGGQPKPQSNTGSKKTTPVLVKGGKYNIRYAEPGDIVAEFEKILKLDDKLDDHSPLPSEEAIEHNSNALGAVIRGKVGSPTSRCRLS
jgi:hypothetical protein